MKAAPVAVLGILLALAESPAAQTPTPTPISPQSLAGYWMLAAIVGGPSKPVEGHRIRGFSDREWFYAQSSPTKNTVDFLFGGSYTISPSGYVETVAFSSPTAVSMVSRVTTLQIRLERDTLTITGHHAFTGSADTDTTEVWHRFVMPPPADAAKSLPSEAEFKEIQLAQQVYSTGPQNLAGAYLNNHARLAMLAEFAKGGMGNANVYLGSEKVTPENIDRWRNEFQHRESVYVGELQRRGTSQIGGSYRLTTAAPCSDPAMDLELKQDGFAIEIRKPGAAGDHVLSGAVVAGVLTVGDGDFSADTYAFGKIATDGHIDLRAFSGQGCAMTLSKR